MIWHKEPLTPTSTLMVHCNAECGRLPGYECGPLPVDPETILTSPVLRQLFFKMDAAGIERTDGFYHGFIHHLCAYDLFQDHTVGELIKSPTLAAQRLEYAGFRFLRTSQVSSLILMGKDSSPLNAVDVWLLNEKDIPAAGAPA